MDFKFGVLLVISAYICTSQALPPCTCTRNYQPICGSDGETYANQCLLECAQYTSKRDITAVREGRCDDPPAQAVDCVCPFNFLPVCGSDGNTYPNDCTLNCQKHRVADLELSHAGACEEKVQPEPLCVCTREKRPVCGSDGNTYSNSCLLNCATRSNSMLSIEHSGPCDNRVKVVDNINF